MAKKDKAKKEKIIWVDDGRTIADMTGIGRKGYTPPQNQKHGRPVRYSAPMKEKLRTFFDAMGFMLLPTLAIVGILILTFLIVYWIL